MKSGRPCNLQQQFSFGDLMRTLLPFIAISFVMAFGK